jgi:beta-N-acetylhexosaminidase
MFFRAAQPFGFILMGRNCQDPEQLRTLVVSLRTSVAHDNAPIFIDMEGGRVARLKPPHWPRFPAAAHIGSVYQQNQAEGLAMARLVGLLIGEELRTLGITANCAPVLDITHPATDVAIGDRAFSNQAETVAVLARAYADGLLEAGVLPVIKHLPGHGYATVDPHLALPVVHEDRASLVADFAPFRALADLPLSMTSHILFDAIDPLLPASQSPTIVQDIIRQEIGFKGLLLSDDLDMKALGGELSERCAKVLAAGTDLLLICNASVAELRSLADIPRMTDASWQRWLAAQAVLKAHAAPYDLLACQEQFAELCELA